MENVTIEKWKLDKIKETLRVVSLNYNCESKETAMDRMVCKSKLYINEALENVETSESGLNKHSVINWVASTDKMPEEKGWYLVYVEGYSKEPKTCQCEYMGGHWWKHPNWGTIDEYVAYWGQIPKPPCL